MQTNKKRIYLGVANYSGCQNQLCPQFSLHLSLHSWSAHFHCQLLLNQELKIQQKGEQKKQIKTFWRKNFVFHNPRTVQDRSAEHG
jgi:hypothetical protein